MNICVIGLEHIGAVSAVCLARLGHTLIGVDVDRQQTEFVGAEALPKTDACLQKLIAEAENSGKFRRAADVRSAVLTSDISLICTGTSSNANGSQNLRELDQVFMQIGSALATKREYHLIVVRSAVLPGTIEGRFTLLLQQHSGRQAGPDFGICMNPGISWAATGIEDAGHAPQMVIGELDSRSGDAAQQIYNGVDVAIIRTSIQAAEMLNYVSSAFHAVKITFANEIGNLCATHGIDGQEVMKYFCLDRELNISSAYLKPGFAFGGPRLPRDLRALLHRAKEQDVACPLLNAVLPSNQCQISRAIELVEKTRRSKIAILGLGFRAGTPDLGENPIIHLAQMLAGKGYCVKIFDESIPSPASVSGTNTPVEDSGAQHNISRLVSPCIQEVIQNSEVVVLASRDTAAGNLHELLSDDQILIDLAGVAREFKLTPTGKHASSS